MAIRGQQILKRNIIKIFFSFGLIILAGVVLKIYFSMDSTPIRNWEEVSINDEFSGFFRSKREGDKNLIGPLGLDFNLLTRKEFILLEKNSDYFIPIINDNNITAFNKNIPPILKEMRIEDPRTGDRLNLFWLKEVAPFIEKIRIYKFQEANSSQGELITELSSDKSNFIDTNVNCGREYYYLLRTVNKDGKESENIKRYMGKPTNTLPPNPPSNIILTPMENSLGLSWRNPNDYDLKYIEIYRFEDSKEEAKLINRIEAMPKEENAYIDKQAEAYKQYYYQLIAVDSAGNKSSSNALKIGHYSNLFIDEF